MKRGKKPKVTENVYKAIKAAGYNMSANELGEIFNISERTVSRVRISESYEAFRRETTEECKKMIKNKTLPKQTYAEPEALKGQVTFYGDALELSRLTGIASILGIEDYEWQISPR